MKCTSSLLSPLLFFFFLLKGEKKTMCWVQSEMLSVKHNTALLGLFLTLIFIALICFIHGKNKAKRTKKLLPPGPKPWPLVGSLLVMLRHKPTFRWIHKLMSELNTEIMCIRLGNVHVITVISPEIAVEFLKTQDAVFSSRPLCMSASLTSGGYLATALTPYGEQWKKMRRIVSSEVLSQAKHRWLRGKRDEEADHLVRYVYNVSKNSTTGGAVNVRYIARHYCGNLIRKLMFGKRFFGEGREDGGPGVEEEEDVESVFTILEHLYSFCVSDYLPWLRGVVDLDGHEMVMRKALSSVRKHQDTEIDKRVKLWMAGTRKEAEDLLDVLILLREADGSPSLSAEEIKAQTVASLLHK